MTCGAPRPRAWIRLHEARIQQAALGGIGLWFLVGWVAAVRRTDGDIANHLELGARFVRRASLYAGGLDYVYPPLWAMAFAPLSLLPAWLARSLLDLLGIAALLALLGALRRLVGEDSRPAWRWTALTAVSLNALVLNRDMADCFVNTILVALAWLGIDQWTRRRAWRGGALVGLATALKCTPGLFLLYFAWRRQWRMAGAIAAFAALFTIAPAVWQGWAGWRAHMAEWAGALRDTAARIDPSQGVLGSRIVGREAEGVIFEDKLGNLSLRPALARYLMRLPYLHLGRPETSDTPARPHEPENPWYVQFLDLSPRAAGLVARGLMVGLLGGVFATFAGEPGAWECAEVSVLMLLLSPVTWTQHCVWLLPGLVFLSDRLRSAKGRATLGLLAVYAAIFLLDDRGLLGLRGVSLLDSYHVKTLGLLCVLAALIHERRSARRYGGSPRRSNRYGATSATGAAPAGTGALTGSTRKALEPGRGQGLSRGSVTRSRRKPSIDCTHSGTSADAESEAAGGRKRASDSTTGHVAAHSRVLGRSRVRQSTTEAARWIAISVENSATRARGTLSSASHREPAMSGSSGSM